MESNHTSLGDADVKVLEEPCGRCGHAKFHHWGRPQPGCHMAVCWCPGWTPAKSAPPAPKPALSWLPDGLGTIRAASNRYHRDGEPVQCLVSFYGGEWEARHDGWILHRGTLTDSIAACEKKENE